MALDTLDSVSKNAEGVRFQLTIVDESAAAVDCSTATERLLAFRKPSGAVVQKTASLSGTSVLTYSSEPGFLDEIGVWEWQGQVTLGGDVKPTLELHRFKVKPSLFS